MKKMKKMISILLAVVMVLAMAVTGFAAEEKGTITIDNAIEGAEYKLYKIFDVAIGTGSSTDKLFSYTISSTSLWYGFVSGTGTGASYVNLTESPAAGTYYVTATAALTEDTAKNFAEAAINYARNNNVAESGSATAEKGQGDAVTAVFSDLELGYYLVDSSAGILCGLNTTQPTVNISEKYECF